MARNLSHLANLMIDSDVRFSVSTGAQLKTFMKADSMQSAESEKKMRMAFGICCFCKSRYLFRLQLNKG